MSHSALGWINYAAASDSVFAVSSQISSLPAENLQNDQGSPSMAWQTEVNSADAFSIEITPVMPGRAWGAFGVFRTNLTYAAEFVVTLYRADGALLYTSPRVVGLVPGVAQLVLVLDADIIADRCRFDFTDPSNPDTFANIPLLFCGPVWRPLTGPSYGSTMGADSGTDETISRGGQEYPLTRFVKRRWDIALDGVRSAEVWSFLSPMDQTSRLGRNCLFVPDRTSPDMMREALYGRLKPTADIGFPYGGADRRSWRGTLTERT